VASEASQLALVPQMQLLPVLDGLITTCVSSGALFEKQAKKTHRRMTRMQSATPIHEAAATRSDGAQDEAAKLQDLLVTDQQEQIPLRETSAGQVPLQLFPPREPRPPSSSRPFTAPHPMSLKTSARSVAMVQKVLRELSGRDGNDQPSLSNFVREGIALQHSILQEIRGRSETMDEQRRAQAASSLAWSRRSDEIMDNMAVLEGVAKELSQKADAHVAELVERQAQREKELVKVAAKAQRDARLLMDRTAAQIELMRHATQTVVRYCPISRNCILMHPNHSATRRLNC
jgi:hypothetical protein